MGSFCMDIKPNGLFSKNLYFWKHWYNSYTNLNLYSSPDWCHMSNVPLVKYATCQIATCQMYHLSNCHMSNVPHVKCTTVDTELLGNFSSAVTLCHVEMYHRMSLVVFSEFKIWNNQFQKHNYVLWSAIKKAKFSSLVDDLGYL